MEDQKLELNLSFTKYTKPNCFSQPITTCNNFSPSSFSSPNSVIYSYMNLNSPFPIMPSTPSTPSFSPSSITHSTTPTASPHPPSSPSTLSNGIHHHHHTALQDVNFNAVALVHANGNGHASEAVLHHHHDLPMPPPAAPISFACASCKYQRRKCGPECVLAPYFPPERQQEFQHAHKLFGVSNIIKKLKELSPSQRQIAVTTMVYEATMHVSNPPGGAHSEFKRLQNDLDCLRAEIRRVQKEIAEHKANTINFETDLHEEPYADQSRSTFISMDDVNQGQRNQDLEEQLQNCFFLNGGLIEVKNNNITDIGSHVDIAYNYLNNDYNHNVVEQETDRDEIIRPFMDVLQTCSDSEEGEERLVCGRNVDMSHMASLNSAPADKSKKCSLALGFSDF